MYFYEKLINDALETASLREVAVAVGVPRATIHDWTVFHKHPRIGTLEKIAAWSGHPVWCMLLDCETELHLLSSTK